MLNRITRRQFFTLVLAAIQTSTLLSDAQVANAIEEYPEDKIVVTIRMAREVVAAKGDREAEHIRCDAVIAYMNTAFDPAGAQMSDVKVLLEDPANLKRDYLDEEELRSLVEAVAPIAVLRELIRTYRVGLRTERSPAFELFADRYRGVIVGSSSPSRNRVTAISTSS